MVEVRPLGLDGVLEIVPRKFGDDRGFFSETYNAQSFAARGIGLTFVQDNHSLSAAAGVLRGLHYQFRREPRTSWSGRARPDIRCRGRYSQRARRLSPNGSGWKLSAEKWNQILVPAGFAHGFVTLEPNTEVVYKVTDYYSPSHDRSIRFDDPDIGIEWPFDASRLQLSAKDQAAPLAGGCRRFRISA